MVALLAGWDSAAGWSTRAPPHPIAEHDVAGTRQALAPPLDGGVQARRLHAPGCAAAPDGLLGPERFGPEPAAGGGVCEQVGRAVCLRVGAGRGGAGSGRRAAGRGGKEAGGQGEQQAQAGEEAKKQGQWQAGANQKIQRPSGRPLTVPPTPDHPSGPLRLRKGVGYGCWHVISPCNL